MGIYNTAKEKISVYPAVGKTEIFLIQNPSAGRAIRPAGFLLLPNEFSAVPQTLYILFFTWIRAFAMGGVTSVQARISTNPFTPASATRSVKIL